MSNSHNSSRAKARTSIKNIAFALVAGLVAILTTPEASNAGAYSIAKAHIGLHERKHPAKIRKIVGVNPQRTPWCGAFAGAVVKRDGKNPPRGFMKAASWRNWGKPVKLKQARKGDVVVIRTKRGYHVGFYAGAENGRVKLIGGNQSNQVKVTAYRASSVRAIRR